MAEKTFKLGEKEFKVAKPTFARMDQLKELGFDFINAGKENLKEALSKDYKKTASALAVIFTDDGMTKDDIEKYIYENCDMVDFTMAMSFFAGAFTERLNAIQTNLSPEQKSAIEKAKVKTPK